MECIFSNFKKISTTLCRVGHAFLHVSLRYGKDMPKMASLESFERLSDPLDQDPSWKGRPGNIFCLSGSLKFFFETFCKCMGFFDIVIRMRYFIPRLITFLFMYFCLLNEMKKHP